jgi:hypothetical protein
VSFLPVYLHLCRLLSKHPHIQCLQFVLSAWNCSLRAWVAAAAAVRLSSFGAFGAIFAILSSYYRGLPRRPENASLTVRLRELETG